MPNQIDFSIATSDQMEAALCKQLENIRLARNMTQAQLAAEAGVSLRTIGRMEQGQGVSLDTFIRVLTAFGIQNLLESLLPDPAVRPIERVNLSGVERQRARPRKPDPQDSTWTWGEE